MSIVLAKTTPVLPPVLRFRAVPCIVTVSLAVPTRGLGLWLAKWAVARIVAGLTTPAAVSWCYIVVVICCSA